MRAQQLGCADARDFEQLGRFHRARAQDDRARRARDLDLSAALELDADRASAIEQHALHLRAGAQREVRPPPHRIEVGVRRAHAPAVLLRDLVVADTVLARAVVVRVARVAAFNARGDERVDQFVALAHVGDVERAVAAAQQVRAAREALSLPEVGQHLVPRPAAVAAPLPTVVVERLAAHLQHAIDRARAADDAPARNRDAPAERAVLRLGLEAPVVDRVVDQLLEARRNSDPRALRLAARLEQQHARARVRAQAVGEHAAGRPRADDDDVPGQSEPSSAGQGCYTDSPAPGRV